MDTQDGSGHRVRHGSDPRFRPSVHRSDFSYRLDSSHRLDPPHRLDSEHEVHFELYRNSQILNVDWENRRGGKYAEKNFERRMGTCLDRKGVRSLEMDVMNLTHRTDFTSCNFLDFYPNPENIVKPILNPVEFVETEIKVIPCLLEQKVETSLETDFKSYFQKDPCLELDLYEIPKSLSQLRLEFYEVDQFLEKLPLLDEKSEIQISNTGDKVSDVVKNGKSQNVTLIPKLENVENVDSIEKAMKSFKTSKISTSKRLTDFGHYTMLPESRNTDDLSPKIEKINATWPESKTEEVRLPKFKNIDEMLPESKNRDILLPKLENIDEMLPESKNKDILLPKLENIDELLPRPRNRESKNVLLLHSKTTDEMSPETGKYDVRLPKFENTMFPESRNTRDLSQNSKTMDEMLPESRYKDNLKLIPDSRNIEKLQPESKTSELKLAETRKINSLLRKSENAISEFFSSRESRNIEEEMSYAGNTVLFLPRSKTAAVLHEKTESTQIVELSGENINSDRKVHTDL